MSDTSSRPAAPAHPWRAPHRFWLDLALVALLGGGFFLLALGGRPYANPDEGRYASIAAEMLASGDWQTPRVNGVQYLYKPPLFYWLEASAARTFGLTPFGLRLAPLLVAVFGLCATYAAGRALFDRRTALWGAGLLGSAFLYYVTSRFLSLDLTLGVFTAAGLFAFIAGIDMPDGWPRRLLLWSLYVCAALAVMTKGLVAAVLIGLTVLLWLAATGRWRLLARAELPIGTLLFLLVAAPWHIAMTIDHPAFFDFYFIREHFERFLTREHHRYEPAWFFLAVLAVGALPWTPLLPAAWRDLGGWWRQRRAPVAPDGRGGGTLFLAIASLAVLAFFSLSSSKLIPYILPLFPPLALLAARPVARFAAGMAVPWLRGGLWATAIAFLAGGIVAPVLAVLGLAGIAPHLLRLQARQMAEGGPAVWLAGLSLLAGGALALYLLRRSAGGTNPDGRLPQNARILFALGLFWLPVLVSANFIAGGVDERSTKAIAALVREVERPGDRVVVYHNYFEDLPVWLNRRLTVVGYHGELEHFLQNEDYSGWLLDQPGFEQLWAGPQRILLVLRKDYTDHLERSGLAPVYDLGEGGNFLLYSNRPPAAGEAAPPE
ncbi:MAG: phospholipid carrier-dependent glycosyltransferase [Sneathiellaceae bacterium]